MGSRSKIGLIVGIIVGLVVGVMVGYAVAPKGIDRIQLEQQIRDLEAQIVILQQQLTTEILGTYFSPRGGCTDQILYWIERANTSIHILIYSFTLDSVSDALVEANDRGVDVKIVFEVQQISQYSEYQRLYAAGILVRNDTNSRYMHNKIMIIDNIIVLTGSFNWSANGEEYNNENLIIIRNSSLSDRYKEEFTKIWDESL